MPTNTNPTVTRHQVGCRTAGCSGCYTPRQPEATIPAKVDKVCTTCDGPVTLSDELVPSGTDRQVICPTHGLNHGVPAVRFGRGGIPYTPENADALEAAIAAGRAERMGGVR